MRNFIRMSVLREKEAISEHLSDFYGMVIDAHILETFQNATAGYIVSHNLNYVIDPVTYKFALEPIVDCVSKRWYERLIKNYSMEEFIRSDGMLDLNALGKLEDVTSFVKSVLEYEEKRVSYLSGEAVALLSLLAEESVPEQKPPHCLIPPYFIIESRELLDLNIKLIKEALEITDELIFAYVPMSSDLLYYHKFCNEIVSKYSELDVDGYFVWATDFNEAKERSISLELFTRFLTSLKSAIGNKQVINMFGGFFSTILATQSIIDGLVHGVGISESRDPYKLGGPAPTRYYVPILHTMLSPESAEDLIENESLACNCPICQTMSPSEMSVKQLIRHVLNAKVSETDEIKSLSLEEIRKMLLRDYNKVVSSVTDPELKKQRVAYASHLLEWRKILKA